MSLKSKFIWWQIKKEIAKMAKENNVLGSLLELLDGKKRNIGLLLIGLGFVIDGLEPLLQSHIPVPLAPISRWLKVTGGGWSAAGGFDALRKGK